MPLAWERSVVRSTSAVFSDFWALCNLPVNATLKRVNLNCYIDMLGTDGTSLPYWASLPIVNTIEVTYGSPPPFPENPGTHVPDVEDFLHYDITTMKGVWKSGGAIQLSTAFNDGDVCRINTTVQRRTNTLPATIWWSWGVAHPGPYPPAGALSRAVASVLYETH